MTLEAKLIASPFFVFDKCLIILKDQKRIIDEKDINSGNR